MSLDANAEKSAIELRLYTNLVGGRIHTSIPEEEILEKDEEGIILPYILLTFGSIFPSERDRSIEGAAQQPNVMPVIVECWAATAQAARATAGAARTLLVGWPPSENNASELELRGGSFFDRRDASGRPTRSMESVTLVTTINMSFDAP